MSDGDYGCSLFSDRSFVIVDDFFASINVQLCCFVITVMIVDCYDVYCDSVTVLCRTEHARRLGKRTVLK